MSIEYESLKQSISPQTIQDRIHEWESMTKSRHDQHSLKQAVIVIRELEQQNRQLGEVRDFFQRVGIKVQEVNQRLVEALEKIAEIDNTWDEPLPTAMRRIANEAIQAYKLLEKKD